MKRFYKSTSADTVEGGFGVFLDGRPLPTPAKAKLVLPTGKLAKAVAAEWDAQGEKIDPASMPLMTLASTTIDRVQPNLDSVRETVAAYGAADLLAYWAERPDELIKRQHTVWGPHLAWAKERFPPGLETTAGVMPVAQPAETLAAMTHAMGAFSAFHLSGIADLTQLSGSLVLSLQLAGRQTGIEAVIRCVQLDELFQEEFWGKDEEATATRAKKERDLRAAARYLELLEFMSS